MKWWVKPTVFVAALLPLALLSSRAVLNQLGANPIEALIHQSGDWALRFLLITLAITPLYQWTRWSFLPGLRRMLGLFAFFYVCLHLLAYVVLDQYFAWSAIWLDVIKRPYITVGFAAFVLLIPLAVTSTNGMMKRLKRRWKTLHRLVYLIGLLGVIHFLWLVKSDLSEPLIYAAILALLLGWRGWRQIQAKYLT